MGESMSTENSVVVLEDLSISFAGAGEPVLRNVNLKIRQGELIGLVGPSGSGKTSLAKAILDTLPTTVSVQGSIHYRKKRGSAKNALSKDFKRGSDVALLAQEPWAALNPALSIGRQFSEAIVAHHPETNRSQIRERTLLALTEVGLQSIDGVLKRYPFEFSGGEQQRICIALSLLHEPRLLIADEPTSSLDATNRNLILDLIIKKVRQANSSLLLISHNEQEVFSRTDRVFRIVQGQLETASRSIPNRGKSLQSTSNSSGELVAKATGLTFAYKGSKTTCFEGIDFELRAGRSLGVVGPSGSGKTTLGRLVAGLLKPTSGELVVLGKDLATEKLSLPDRKLLAMIFQDSSLSFNPRMRVRQILLEPLKSHKERLTPAMEKDYVEKALEGVGLDIGLIDRFPRFLSGGQRQRLNIARSLMLRPKILIADEPTSSLDIESAKTSLGLIRKLQNDLGFALILISHDSQLISEYTDSVLRVGVEQSEDNSLT